MHTRPAFTIIELLVVIAIIAVLAGLLVSGIAALRANAKKNKTTGICATLLQGVQLHGADRGGLVAPVPHPLTGLSGNWDASAKAAAAICSDARCPLLYGLPGTRAGILGVRVQALTGSSADSKPEDSKPFLQYVLSYGNALAELANQKALYYHDPISLPANILPSSGGGGACLVYSDDPSPSAGSDISQGASGWQPGLVKSGNPAGSGRWKRYRIPGMAAYDAWDREILYAYDPIKRRASFLSAGADGAFVWAPPVDGDSYATAANKTGTTPDGKDSYAGSDNIVVGDD